jgi:hypothetical protein
MNGNTATTVKSKKLDQDVRNISKEKFTTLLERRSKIPTTSKLQTGLAPDGGVFYDGETPVIAFEAKHQGNSGNAIERGWNNVTVGILGHNLKRYVLFMTGEGAKRGNVLDKHAITLHEVFNGKVVCYLSADGFSKKQIRAIMQYELQQV